MPKPPPGRPRIQEGAKRELRAPITEKKEAFLDRETFAALTVEQGELRDRIAELNWKINTTGKKGDLAKIPPEKRAAAKQEWLKERNRLVARSAEVQGLLLSAEAARKQVLAFRTSDTIGQALMRARDRIAELVNASGQDWSDEDRMLCGELRRLARAPSPEGARLEAILAEKAQEHQREIAGYKARISAIRAALEALATRRSEGADFLEHLFAERYAETDQQKRARGVVSRLHLTEQDERRWLEAIGLLRDRLGEE